MTTVNTHLKTTLKRCGRYELTSDERKLASKNIHEYIYKKLTSKKFRKWKLDPICSERVTKAIEIQVRKNQPIKATFFQGGYKLWRFPTSPQVDWAEFFNLAYVIAYVAPIASAYKPGVDLTYYCHTLLMELHDNLTTAEINEYMDSLQTLFDEFSAHVPKNIHLKILRDADIYPRQEYFKALEAGKIQAEKEVESWSETKVADFERMAKLNIKWHGREDWTSLNETQKKEKIHLAALYEQAATSNLPKVMEMVKSPDTILLFTKPSPIFIGIGSTRTSIAKHWVGYGVIESDKEKYYERILTPSQYESVKNLPHLQEKVTVSKLKNLQTIKVYQKRFNFTHKT